MHRVGCGGSAGPGVGLGDPVSPSWLRYSVIPLKNPCAVSNSHLMWAGDHLQLPSETAAALKVKNQSKPQKSHSRARCWAPGLHPLQEPVLQSRFAILGSSRGCSRLSSRCAQHNQIILKVFSNPVHSVILSTHRPLPRARIKLWHTWKIQVFTHVNLSHHLESPAPLQGAPGADGLREPQDCVDTIHCYANTQLLLKLASTLLAAFVSKHPKGRQQ